MSQRRIVRAGTVLFALACANCTGDLRSVGTTAAAGLDPTQPIPPQLFEQLKAEAVLPAEEAGQPGGTFAVTDAGAATYSYPLWVVPGRRGVQPSFQITYSSLNSRNGPLGLGWALAGFGSIRRCQRDPARDGATRGVQFQDDDALCMGGQRLVHVAGSYGRPNSEYRVERDGFVRVTLLGAALGNTSSRFRVEHPDGSVSTYSVPFDQYLLFEGGNGDPTAGGGADRRRVATYWPLTEYRDVVGNGIKYRYSATFVASSGAWDHRIEQVEYNLRAGSESFDRYVKFNYQEQERPDVDVAYVAGFGTTSTRLIESIESHGPEGLARRVKFAYRQSRSSGRSLLSSIDECEGFGQCLSPIQFDYHDEEAVVTQGSEDAGGNGPLGFGVGGQFVITPIPTTRGWRGDLIDRIDFTGELYTSGDFDGNGQDDFLVRDPIAARLYVYTRNSVSGRDYDSPVLAAIPSSATTLPFTSVDDFDHDGQHELVVQTSSPVFNGAETVSSLYRWHRGNFELLESPLTSCRSLLHDRFVGDVDLDGANDVIEFCGRCLPGDCNRNFTIDVHRLSNAAGDGGTGDYFDFSPESVVDSGRSIAWQPSSFDYNSDGSPEWLVQDIDDTHLAWTDFRGNRTASQLRANELRVFIDANGDGLQDAVNVDDKTLRLSTGVGFAPPRPWTLEGEDVSWDGYEQPEEAGDAIPLNLDGDGRDDFLVFMRRPDGTARAVGYRSKGTYFEAFVYGEIGLPPTREGRANYGNVSVLDWNGDGLSDLAYPNLVRGNRDRLMVRWPDWDVPDLLAEVRDNTGTWTTSYGKPLGKRGTSSRTTSYPLRQAIPRNMRVVAQHTEPTTGAYTHELNEPTFDVRARQSLGFTQHIITREHDGQVTYREFDFNLAREGNERGLFYGAGIPIRERVYTPVGGDLHVTQRFVRWRKVDLESSDGEVFAVVPQEVIEDTFLGPSEEFRPPSFTFGTRTPAFRRVFRSSYDEWGNLTRLESTWSERPNPVLRPENQRILGHTIVERTFENRASDWLIGLVSQQTVSDTNDRASEESRRARLTSYQYNTRGLLTETTRAPGDPRYQLRTTYTYDAFGNPDLKTETSADGEVRTLNRDYDATGTFLLRETNTLGHATLYGTHPNLGLPMLVVDANRAEQRFKYDGFGRMRESRDATGVEETTSFSETVRPGAALTVSRSSNTGESTRIHLDTHYRVSSIERLGPDGNWSTATRAYDETTGRLSSWTRFRKPGERTETFTLTHDNLGRVSRQEYPDGTAFTFSYGENNVITRHPSGRMTRQVFDGRGRLTLLVDSADSVSNASLVQQTYRYGPFDQLATVEQSSGPESRTQRWNFEYDVWSNLTGTSDPDAGARSFGYNPWFERSFVENASGQRHEYVRDSLGRVQEIQSPEGTTRYLWDVQELGGIGRIESAESPDGVVDRFGYLQSGLIASRTREMDGQTFRTQYKYGDSGLLDEVDLQMGHHPMTLRYGYQAGLVSSVSRVVNDGSPAGVQEVFWEAMERDGQFRPTSVAMNDGALTQRSSFDLGTGELLSRTTSAGVSTPVQDIGYEYGRLLVSRYHDALASRTESFEYDHLNRVTRWDAPEQGDVSFGYDVFSNLTRKGSDLFQYGDPDHPSTLTAVNGEEVGHDANGRRVSGHGIAATYTSFDMPRTLNQSSYRYAPDESRAHVASPLGEVLMDGESFERRELRSGKAIDFYRVVADGVEVAQVVWNDDEGAEEIQFLHRDRLGRVHTVTDRDNNIVSRFLYSPFGAREDSFGMSTPDGSLQRSFGLQEYDLTEPVIDMGGRVMVPEEGRFLTPDPLWAATQKPTALNRYVLAHGNPLNLIDPDGFQPLVDRGEAGGREPGISAFGGGTGFGGGGTELANALGLGGGELPPTLSTTLAGAADGLGTALRSVGSALVNVNAGSAQVLTASPLLGFISTGSVEGTLSFSLSQALTDSTTLGSAIGIDPDSVAYQTGEWGASVGTVFLPGGATVAGLAKAATQLRGVVSAARAAGRSLLSFRRSSFGHFLRGGSGRRVVSSGACFSAGTLVHAQEGLVPIEKIEVGDLVWARDESTGEEALRPVIEVFVTPRQELLDLVVEGISGTQEELDVTAEHPFWVDGKGWIPAYQLKPGDSLEGLSSPRSLHVVSVIPSRDYATVYNFEVQGFHTYFVGENGAWVHNVCGAGTIRVSRDPFSIRATVAGDPRAFARIEVEGSIARVTDVFRGNLPQGSGSELVAAALREAGVGPGGRLVFSNITNPATRAAFTSGSSPAMSVLGRTGSRALEKLGLRTSGFAFEQVRGKLNLVIGIQ